MSFWDRLLDRSASAEGAWVWADDRYDRRPYAQTYEEARHVAAALKRRGVRDGDVVAAVITNSWASVSSFFGAWWAGATVASLPIIARGQAIDEYVSQLKALCAALGADCLMIESRFAGFLVEAGLGPSPAVLECEQLSLDPGRADVTPPPEDDVVFIQFSSGTTAKPRGVELTGRAIESQLSRIVDALSIDPARDIGLMWLPMSHDMGFFGGNLLVRYTGMEGVLFPPERFLAQPWTWFQDCARFAATITLGPSFAYELAARSAGSNPLPGMLSLRLCLVGAEQISMSHLRSCADAFGQYGFSLRPFTPAYGLAEATLAVSITDVASEPRSISVDADALAEGALATAEPGARGAKELVCCGPPLRDFSAWSEGEVGELYVRGPSLANGYRGQPELTAARFKDGAFATGDLGFVLDDELYLVGRDDDRLIVGGRNVDVADIEEELGEDRRIRKGNCVIVDVRENGSQQLVFVAEATAGTEASDLLSHARTIAARRHGLRLDDVVLLERGQFPKTPSGKAQRYRCREIAAAAAR